MNNLSQLDLAYIAGFIDGEGCISVHMKKLKRGSVSFATHFDIINTNLEILKWIKDILDCGIIEKKAKTKGWKQCYHLFFRINEIELILPKLLEHLKVKHEQARLVLDFLQLDRTRGNNYVDPEILQEKIIISAQLAELNTRGERTR
jgi:hypothetical protein